MLSDKLFCVHPCFTCPCIKDTAGLSTSYRIIGLHPHWGTAHGRWCRATWTIESRWPQHRPVVRSPRNRRAAAMARRRRRRQPGRRSHPTTTARATATKAGKETGAHRHGAEDGGKGEELVGAKGATRLPKLTASGPRQKCPCSRGSSRAKKKASGYQYPRGPRPGRSAVAPWRRAAGGPQTAGPTPRTATACPPQSPSLWRPPRVAATNGPHQLAHPPAPAVPTTSTTSRVAAAAAHAVPPPPAINAIALKPSPPRRHPLQNPRAHAPTRRSWRATPPRAARPLARRRAWRPCAVTAHPHWRRPTAAAPAAAADTAVAAATAATAAIAAVSVAAAAAAVGGPRVERPADSAAAIEPSRPPPPPRLQPGPHFRRRRRKRTPRRGR